ncbi:uncharacterized protein TNIN_347391 [Trichonephila inaurata madagascariensis]|uniref:CPR type cuticle protein n=1 Tax=Trichonephila inaurata madagascariensis TaxID=2747483 RepID=A0A8X6XR20_9ARAC|nr:uncharacterized protein TNIN_347391 [Trichonephila inaurata madagascariensis]
MKVLVLLSLAALACASVYELPEVHDEHHYEEIPVAVSHKSYHAVPVQSVSHYHPALLGHHYPVKKVVVHYPSGLYHGPHGLGIYNPKLHDELEQAYYRG